MKTAAYLRVSTAQQDVRSQRLAILEYARKHDFRIDDFIEATASRQASEKRRWLDELMHVLQRGDRLVVSELSRLGRSLGQIVAILDALAKARSSGRKLGRPKGSLGVSRLNGKEADIRRFLELGLSKTAIAKLTGVSRTTLYSFMRTRGPAVHHRPCHCVGMQVSCRTQANIGAAPRWPFKLCSKYLEINGSGH